MHRRDRQVRKISRSEPEIGQRVGSVGIESRRHEQPGRCEFLRQRRDDLVERQTVRVTGRPCGERQVHRRARAGTGSDFAQRPGPGIEGELVERHVKDVGPVVEHLLGPVAVVGVPVEHHDPLALCGKQAGGDRDVVEQAETHRSGGERVVPGRPHREEGSVAFTAPETLDRVGTCSRGSKGCLEGGPGSDGVLVEVPAPARAVVLDACDVRRVMDDLELGARRPTRLEREGRLGGGGLLDAGEHCLEPLGPFGMPSSRVVGGEFLVSSEQHHHCTTVPSSDPTRSDRTVACRRHVASRRTPYQYRWPARR